MRTTTALSCCLVVATAAPALAGTPLPEQRAFEEQLKAAPPTAAGGKAYDFSAGNVDGELGSTRMRKANRAAAKLVHRRMQRDRGNDLRLLREAAAADFVIVSGQYDRVEDVLAAMSVRSVVIPPDLVARLDLMATQTLMVNCPGHFSAEGIARVRDFVTRGGYLVTTDWALKNLIEPAFPKTIEFNGKQTRDDVVSVRVHAHGEPLLAHVDAMGQVPQWWLESASYPIHILDRARVKVLMDSAEMRDKYGSAPVVVAFRHEDGKVLHMTSHFYLQKAKLVAKADKQGAKEVATKAGLSPTDVAELAAAGVDMDDVAAGEIGSAYAMQQLSTNLLVAKQKANEQLMKQYTGSVTEDVRLSQAPGAAPRDGADTVGKGFRVKVLEERGDAYEIQDLFGHRGWVPRTSVKR